MILRLTLAIAALCDLDHQRLHGTQLMIQECKQTVVELMKDIPSDLHTGVAEYMEKKRAGEVVNFKNIEDILSNRKSPTTTVGTTQLPANDGTFSELAIG